MQHKKRTLAGIAFTALILASTLAYFYHEQNTVIGTPSNNPALLTYKAQLKTVVQNKKNGSNLDLTY